MIKFEKDEMTHEWNLTLGKDTFIHTTNDWRQFYNLLTGKSKYNWYTFHIINVYFENDIICPGIDIEIALLGFGLRFRHNRSWEGTILDERKKEVDELIKQDIDATYKFNKDTIARMHEELIKAYGGLAGIRDEALLDSAIYQTELATQYESLTPRDMAASYCYLLCQNHPFTDGNKRTACAAMLVYLRCHGLRIAEPQEEILTTMLNIVSGTLSKQQLAEWLPCDQWQSSTPRLISHIDELEAMRHFKDIKKQYDWLFRELAK